MAIEPKSQTYLDIAESLYAAHRNSRDRELYSLLQEIAKQHAQSSQQSSDAQIPDTSHKDTLNLAESYFRQMQFKRPDRGREMKLQDALLQSLQNLQAQETELQKMRNAFSTNPQPIVQSNQQREIEQRIAQQAELEAFKQGFAANDTQQSPQQPENNNDEGVIDMHQVWQDQDSADKPQLKRQDSVDSMDDFTEDLPIEHLYTPLGTPRNLSKASLLDEKEQFSKEQLGGDDYASIDNINQQIQQPQQVAQPPESATNYASMLRRGFFARMADTVSAAVMSAIHSIVDTAKNIFTKAPVENNLQNQSESNSISKHSEADPIDNHLEYNEQSEIDYLAELEKLANPVNVDEQIQNLDQVNAPPPQNANYGKIPQDASDYVKAIDPRYKKYSEENQAIAAEKINQMKSEYDNLDRIQALISNPHLIDKPTNISSDDNYQPLPTVNARPLDANYTVLPPNPYGQYPERGYIEGKATGYSSVNAINQAANAKGYAELPKPLDNTQQPSNAQYGRIPQGIPGKNWGEVVERPVVAESANKATTTSLSQINNLAQLFAKNTTGTTKQISADNGLFKPLINKSANLSDTNDVPNPSMKR